MVVHPPSMTTQFFPPMLSSRGVMGLSLAAKYTFLSIILTISLHSTMCLCFRRPFHALDKCTCPCLALGKGWINDFDWQRPTHRGTSWSGDPKFSSKMRPERGGLGLLLLLSVGPTLVSISSAKKLELGEIRYPISVHLIFTRMEACTQRSEINMAVDRSSDWLTQYTFHAPLAFFYQIALQKVLEGVGLDCTDIVTTLDGSDKSLHIPFGSGYKAMSICDAQCTLSPELIAEHLSCSHYSYKERNQGTLGAHEWWDAVTGR